MRTRKLSRRQKYFLKQKILGLISVITGMFSVPLLDGDGTFALVMVPLGLFLIFTRQMCFCDNAGYFSEYGGR